MRQFNSNNGITKNRKWKVIDEVEPGLQHEKKNKVY